jgi:hypothetical protein
MRPGERAAIPGKQTLTMNLPTKEVGQPVQRKGEARPPADVHAQAAQGVSGSAMALPYNEHIQKFFGAHDVSRIKAHADGPAAQACEAMGAGAYAMGDHVAFHGAPDLHTAAHEAAHVVQQRSGVQLEGGVGQNGDPYERNADAVADAVVAGTSAEPLLDQVARSRASAAAPAAAVQGDFWSSLGRGWEMYSGMTDEGAPFAQKLMRWRMIGLGADYRTRTGDDWDEFMSARPEIQRAMAARFPTLVAGFAGQPDTGNEWMGGWKSFTDTVTNVRLNELESMRLTLHGCHRIEINGRYWKGIENGVVTVKLGGVQFTWVDRADLHPGTTTELESGAQVDDQEFTSAGSDYDIYIAFSMPSISTWTVSGSPAHTRGWPPITGAPAAGFRG